MSIWRLQVVSSPATPPRPLVVLDGSAKILGRDAAADVELPDGEVSRQHARVELDTASGTYHVVDLASRNGVIVDGLAVTRARLDNGSVIRLGSSLLLFLAHELPRRTVLHAERPGLLGQSPGMHRLRGDIAMVAPRPTGVLVVGETGAGKERVAAEIHAQSGRPGRYVTVECTAESELFAPEGLFVAAHRGTLFLDEVGELAPALQAELLRVLATGELRPVGANISQSVDVRVVAASHQTLRERAAIYAHLSGWVIEVPPLRERREDVLRLAASFLAAATLSASASEALLLHAWPFNVRELRHVVEAGAVRAGADRVVQLEHLPDEIASRVRRGGSSP
jgi:DNA-binding NtrC family response regulator